MVLVPVLLVGCSPSAAAASSGHCLRRSAGLAARLPPPLPRPATPRCRPRHLPPAGFQAGLEYLLRVAFGTALIASVMLVFLAITVLMSSASSRDDNRGGGRSGGGGGGGFFGPRVYFNLTDLLWYWDPFWYRNRRDRMAREQRPGGMNFLEAIFSWVFGDGDPNADFDKKRWQAVRAGGGWGSRVGRSAGGLRACRPFGGSLLSWVPGLCGPARLWPACHATPAHAHAFAIRRAADWAVHCRPRRYGGGRGAGSLPGPAARAAGRRPWQDHGWVAPPHCSAPCMACLVPPPLLGASVCLACSCVPAF